MMAFNANAEKINSNIGLFLEAFVNMTENSVSKEFSTNLDKIIQALASSALATSDVQIEDTQTDNDGEVKENE